MDVFLSRIKKFLTSNSAVEKVVRKVYGVLPVVLRKYLSQKTEVGISDLERHYKIIFVHVPKCAGNGLLRSLFGIGGMRHSEIKQIMRKYPEEYRTYRKISVVRNPYDRFVSAFYYLKEGGMGHFDEEFSRKYLHGYSDVNDLAGALAADKLLRLNVLNWTHFKPQVDFLTVEGVLVMDKIVRLECLNDQYDSLVEYIGVKDYGVLRKHNATTRKDRDLTEISKQIIYDLYREDFELLGYEK